MAEGFALISNQGMLFDQELGEVHQKNTALKAGRIGNAGPDGEKILTGCDCVAGGRPAGAGARARSAHGWASARGEEAARVREAKR